MPRRCTICDHDQQEAINKALVACEPFRHIAARYDTSTGALQRHKKHLPLKLTKAQEAQEVAQADGLLAEMQKIQKVTLSILARAVRAHDLRTALVAIRETRGNVELLAKLVGQLQQEGTVNIILAAEWIQLRTVILTALVPFPDARLAVARAVGNGHARH